MGKSVDQLRKNSRAQWIGAYRRHGLRAKIRRLADTVFSTLRSSCRVRLPGITSISFISPGSGEVYWFS
jgi:hypothetical protein